MSYEAPYNINVLVAHGREMKGIKSVVFTMIDGVRGVLTYRRPLRTRAPFGT